MSIGSLSIDFRFLEPLSLCELNIQDFSHTVSAKNFLTDDRGSQEIFPASLQPIPPEVVASPDTLWDGEMKINRERVTVDKGLLIPRTSAVHLKDIRLVCDPTLVIYKDNFILKNYISESMYGSAASWVRKVRKLGRVSLSRTKALNRRTVQYDAGIDFSTDKGDLNVYHWIARVLPKLKCVRELPNDLPLIFGYQPSKLQLECLTLFEIKNPILVINRAEISKFLSFILIEGPWAVGNMPKSQWLRSEALGKLGAAYQSRIPKIFVARAATANRVLKNRGWVKEFLSSRSFHVLELDGESYSFSDQVRIFSNATDIVFEHGAAGIWLTFAQPGARVLEILPVRNHRLSPRIADFFFWHCMFLGHKYDCLISKDVRLKPWAEFEVDPHEFARKYRMLFGT